MELEHEHFVVSGFIGLLSAKVWWVVTWSAEYKKVEEFWSDFAHERHIDISRELCT